MIMKKLFIILFTVITIFNALAQESDCKISYDNLKWTLSNSATHRHLTAFINLDYAFSEFRLQEYMLDSLDLAHHWDGFKWESPTHWTEEYRPKLLIGNDIKYLKLHYYLKETDDTPLTQGNKCKTLVKCEIIGTPTLVVKLFSHYWEREIEIGGGNKGEKAHIDFMGDHIALYHINDNLYKIVITDNGRNFNYKCNFRERE